MKLYFDKKKKVLRLVNSDGVMDLINVMKKDEPVPGKGTLVGLGLNYIPKGSMIYTKGPKRIPKSYVLIGEVKRV